MSFTLPTSLPKVCYKKISTIALTHYLQLVMDLERNIIGTLTNIFFLRQHLKLKMYFFRSRLWIIIKRGFYVSKTIRIPVNW
jgi:hypothetical protein